MKKKEKKMCGYCGEDVLTYEIFENGCYHKKCLPSVKKLLERGKQ